MSNSTKTAEQIETASGGRGDGAKNAVVLRTESVKRVFVDGDRKLEVLKGVSLSLRSGEVASLIGRSGSGKSTLLHLLGLLDKPSEGEIFIDNTPAGNLNETSRAYLRNHHIGFVFQHYFLLPEFNVLENVLIPGKIALGPQAWLAQKAQFEQRAKELLKLVELDSHATQRPTTLSGGERQRVSLARALLLNPKILLCDEPTGNLDPETARSIMDLIFALSHKGGAAVLVVTHDRAVSERAERILRLEHGVLSTDK